MVGQYSGFAHALSLFDGGSERRAYMLDERISDRTHVAEAIRSVARRGSMRGPEVFEGLVAAGRRARRSPLADRSARERESSKNRPGQEHGAIAESLLLTKRAVEKHINAIFIKTRLADDEDVSKRVKAALMS